jgi:hypothetical protein
MEEVTAFKEAHQGKGHITLKLEGQVYDPALEQGLMLLARGALAVDAFSQDHPHLTHYGLMAFELALSGPGGFVLGQVAQGSGLSQTVYDKIEQGEQWLARHLEHKAGLDGNSADLLASAGSFGMQFAIPALVGSKSKQVVDAAHKVTNKVKEGVKKVHGNSLDYVGPCHVYKIKKGGVDQKYGESTQGLNKFGQSKRAEQQARKLQRETGEQYETEIVANFKNKRTAKDFEHQEIKQAKAQDPNALPLNKGLR